MNNTIKFLAIDYGAKKIGLALADSETKLATPYKIVANDKDILTKIKSICEQEKVDKLIVGIPLGLKGIKSKQYQEVLDFIKILEKELNLEIVQQDENLSTRFAQKLLKESTSTKLDDAVAAMIVLQSYLDKLG